MSIGVIATIGQDLWEVICKHVFRLPTGDIALVGRWLGHIPRGVLVHHAISESTAISKERWIGWIAHYVTGIVYGVTYLGIVLILPLSDPTLLSALVFALACLVAPQVIRKGRHWLGISRSFLIVHQSCKQHW